MGMEENEMGFLLELIVDLIVDGWTELMQWIIPKKMANNKLRLVLKGIVFVVSLLLFLSMIFGIVAMLNPDPFTHMVGRKILFIALGISAAQILLGILVRSFLKK